MMEKFGASMGCPRCQNGMGTHTHACRARVLSSMAPQTSVAAQAPAQLTWQLTDKGSGRRQARP